MNHREPELKGQYGGRGAGLKFYISETSEGEHQ
jgi:hypothetical protein